MSSTIDEAERVDADQTTEFGNDDINFQNTNTTIKIEQNEEDEDGHHVLLENYTSTENKNTNDVKDDKYLDSNLSWQDLYPQTLASCISLLLVIQPGINLAYSNNMLHHMPLLNKEQLSWITSILSLCIPVGSFMVGLIMDRIGRKKSCFLSAVPLLASWMIAIIPSSNRIFIFIASRIFSGVGAGMAVASLVYVSEISHSSYKQLLLALNSVFFSCGVLISTSMMNLDLTLINFIFIGLTVVNMALILVFMPESPIWLIKFKDSANTNKAKKAVEQIYPKNNRLFEAEWRRLKATSNGEMDLDEPSFVETIRTNPSAYRPMIILAFLLFLQQLSGAYPTISYALPILNSIMTADHLITEIQSLAMLGTIRFVSSLVACALSFYVGRRPLMMWSCVGMALSAALVAFASDEAVASQTTFHGGEPAKIPLSLCGVMLFVLSSSMGVLVFPWTMVCELLPTSVRAIGGAVLVSYSYLIMFVVMKVFPDLLAALTVPYVFAVFGVVSLTMAAYVYFVVPETLGKNFNEIEEYFTSKDKSSPHRNSSPLPVD